MVKLGQGVVDVLPSLTGSPRQLLVVMGDGVIHRNTGDSFCDTTREPFEEAIRHLIKRRDAKRVWAGAGSNLAAIYGVSGIVEDFVGPLETREESVRLIDVHAGLGL